jgi:hypothetical protein
MQAYIYVAHLLAMIVPTYRARNCKLYNAPFQRL